MIYARVFSPEIPMLVWMQRFGMFHGNLNESGDAVTIYFDGVKRTFPTSHIDVHHSIDSAKNQLTVEKMIFAEFVDSFPLLEIRKEGIASPFPEAYFFYGSDGIPRKGQEILNKLKNLFPKYYVVLDEQQFLQGYSMFLLEYAESVNKPTVFRNNDCGHLYLKNFPKEASEKFRRNKEYPISSYFAYIV